MTDLVLADRAADWRRLKDLVLDSVSSPITCRVYNLGLDEFIEWFGLGWFMVRIGDRLMERRSMLGMARRVRTI